MTKDGRLPWMPESLGERLEREIAARERRRSEWMKDPVRTRAPQDDASVRKTYATLQRTDPQGAERYLASMQALASDIRHNPEILYPRRTRQLEQALEDAKRYKAGFTATELAAPAVSPDQDGKMRAQVDPRIQQLHAPPPEERQRTEHCSKKRVHLSGRRNRHSAAAIRRKLHGFGQSPPDCRSR